jgi:hypothetical protein
LIDARNTFASLTRAPTALEILFGNRKTGQMRFSAGIASRLQPATSLAAKKFGISCGRIFSVYRFGALSSEGNQKGRAYETSGPCRRQPGWRSGRTAALPYPPGGGGIIVGLVPHRQQNSRQSAGGIKAIN